MIDYDVLFVEQFGPNLYFDRQNIWVSDEIHGQYALLSGSIDLVFYSSFRGAVAMTQRLECC